MCINTDLQQAISFTPGEDIICMMPSRMISELRLWCLCGTIAFLGNKGGDRLVISHAQTPHISEPIEANHLETSALPLVSMRLEISGRKKIFPRNRTRQCALGPFLRPNMYLWCYWSNLGM